MKMDFENTKSAYKLLRDLSDQNSENISNSEKISFLHFAIVKFFFKNKIHVNNTIEQSPPKYGRSLLEQVLHLDHTKAVKGN